MKLYFSFWAVCLFYSVSSAQNNYYVRIFGGENQDFHKTFIEDELLLEKAFSASIGVVIGKSLSERWEVEAGIIYKPYHIKSYPGLDLRTIGQSNSNISFNSIQVPIRARASFPLVQNKIFICSNSGFNLAYNKNFRSHGQRESIRRTPYAEVVSSRTFDSRLKKFFFLLETGVDLEFRLTEKISVLLNGTYLASLSDPVSNEFVTYQINDGPIHNVKSFVLGDYFNLGVGVKYRFVR